MTPEIDETGRQSLRPTRAPMAAYMRLLAMWHIFGMGRKFAIALAAAAAASGFATVLTMTGWQSTPNPDPDTVLVLLYIDAVLLLLLGVVVARRMVMIWSDRRRGQAGSGLHTRLVLMFALVAVTPAILVAIFSALFLNFGIQTWFSDRIRTALEESNAVAIAYLHEHQQNIRADALITANDLNAEANVLIRNPVIFSNYLSKQVEVRSLSEAIVINSNGRVLARSRFSQSLEFDLVPKQTLATAESGSVAVITTANDNRVRAVVRLTNFADAFLLVGRFVDAKVLDHIEKTKGAVAKYQNLEKNQGGIQITFVMIYGLVAMMLLMVSAWVGLTLAGQMSRPISSLISASERVRGGDLSVRVDETDGTDEIGNLGRSFNKMTTQLQSQQQVLVEANRMLDERRRFTETVLTGVSAGVIGLDSEGRIHLPNRSASDLLGRDLDLSAAAPLGDVIPEMADLLESVMARPDRPFQDEIQIPRGGKFHTLHVSMVAEKLGGDILGYVVTFDDVTDLLTAQRTAAWADVARRIAHEIKNPLTPIQLSAERLKRKYLKTIEDDPETFASLTDTIVRQVKDIGRMVDEFSSFARMPLASLKNENIVEICKQSVVLERQRQPKIKYELKVPELPLMLRCDRRQIGQALNNLLKNAAESVTESGGKSKVKNSGGWICCSISSETGKDGESQIAVIVEDNGKGLPVEERHRLTEPYVTTRDGGTGLGLAIVRKIMEDHNGDLQLEDRPEGGVRAVLAFLNGGERRKINSANKHKHNRRVSDTLEIGSKIHGA